MLQTAFGGDMYSCPAATRWWWGALRLGVGLHANAPMNRLRAPAIHETGEGRERGTSTDATACAGRDRRVAVGC